jgi:Outer membrane lipoprotein carrier protein LolA
MAGHGAWVGVLLLGAVTATSAAMAETVPLPIPAPLPKERGPAATGQAQRPTAQVPTTAPAPAQQPSGFLEGVKSLFSPSRPAEAPAATGSTTTAEFSAGQRAQADKVSQYLSNVQQMSGKFVQVGPDGTRVKGDFFIQKPGKVRFEYDPPTPIEIVADGQSVVVRNSRLATQDLYPLSQTPLRFLLSERIDLLRDTNVVGIRSDDVFVTIVIEEKQPPDDDGRRQGLPAQAVDRDRPAGLRHHGRGLASRKRQADGSEPVPDRLYALRSIAPSTRRLAIRRPILYSYSLRRLIRHARA